ncbi:MAG: hypothetical protein PHN69_02170, partial [Candidatus Pacebacteria bacterium]|nr:hypothetical protein [Candidatus Paceibacterota bacterium]
MKKTILVICAIFTAGALLPSVSFASSTASSTEIVCKPNTSTATIDQNITWIVTGVPEGYTYTWGLDENGNPVSADNAPMTNSYGTIGSKTNTVIIGNGTEENQTITCSPVVVKTILQSTMSTGGISCSPATSTATIDQNITWIVTGVPEGYTYTWGLDENGNPVSADNAPMT